MNVMEWEKSKIENLHLLSKDELIEVANENYAHRNRLTNQLAALQMYLFENKILDSNSMCDICNNAILHKSEKH